MGGWGKVIDKMVSYSLFNIKRAAWIHTGWTETEGFKKIKVEIRKRDSLFRP